MPRNRRSLLSDSTKMQIARAQGAGNRVSPGDYGNLTSREAGSFTKYALIVAQQALAGGTPTLPGPGATNNTQ